jgi:putative transposase
MQRALEDEVSEFLGRERYRRAGDGWVYRNGYERRMVKTTSGARELERPRIRITTDLGFESQVLGEGVACTHALEALMILGFLRGLSDSDRLFRRADDVSASRSAPVTRDARGGPVAAGPRC